MRDYLRLLPPTAQPEPELETVPLEQAFAFAQDTLNFLCVTLADDLTASQVLCICSKGLDMRLAQLQQTAPPCEVPHA
jgi:hypothetical protein